MRRDQQPLEQRQTVERQTSIAAGETFRHQQQELEGCFASQVRSEDNSSRRHDPDRNSGLAGDEQHRSEARLAKVHKEQQEVLLAEQKQYKELEMHLSSKG